jgi:lipopolysaccharide export LptBFGC system permease protein LptF
LGLTFLIFDFWGPTYFSKQQKYLEKIMKKLAGVGVTEPSKL